MEITLPSPRRVALVALGLCAASAATASAQSAPERRTFPAERLRPTLDGCGLLDVEWAEVPAHRTWTLALWLGQATDVGTLGTGARVGERLGGNLAAAVALWGRLELGLDLPITLDQSHATSATLAPSGLGDLRVAAKHRLPGWGKTRLAGLLAVTLPSGGGVEYLGDRWATLAPELLIARPVGRLRLAANLGYRARHRTTSAQQVIDDELTGRVGVGIALPLGGASLALDGSLGGSLAAAAPGRADGASIEALAAASYPVAGRVVATVGGGRGLSSGLDAPDWRVFAGLRYQGGTRRDRAPRRAGTVAATPTPTSPCPVGAGAPVVVAEDGTVVLDAITNCFSATATIAIEIAPSHGILHVTEPGRLRYQPVADYHGADSFTYAVMRPGLAPVHAQVAIQVTAINDRPQAIADVLAVAEDASGSISVLFNDQQLGDGGVTVTVTKQPIHGTATVGPSQVIRFTPITDFVGSDSLTYRVTDRDGEVSTATVEINVLGVDDVPAARDDRLDVAYATAGEVAVLANDAGLGDRPMALVVTTAPAHGTATVTATRAIRYQPAPDFVGVDLLVYTVTDADGQSSSATASFTVAAPTARQREAARTAVPPPTPALAPDAPVAPPAETAAPSPTVTPPPARDTAAPPPDAPSPEPPSADAPAAVGPPADAPATDAPAAPSTEAPPADVAPSEPTPAAPPAPAAPTPPATPPVARPPATPPPASARPRATPPPPRTAPPPPAPPVTGDDAYADDR